MSVQDAFSDALVDAVDELECDMIRFDFRLYTGETLEAESYGAE